MASPHLTIGFVRRGFSRSGGAEAYLQRLAAGVIAAGHRAVLITSPDWPETEWPFGERLALPAKTPTRFAEAVARARLGERCDIVLSLERVRQCDIYRAGDGVHRAWMERRARGGGPRDRLSVLLNPKHQRLLRLEEALFRQRGARRVIANSFMVKREIEQFYSYPAERIDVVYNGVPLEKFQFTENDRARQRAALGLEGEDVALLFVGSGWERKGLATALRALEELDHPRARLLIAGRGQSRRFQSAQARFLGEVADVAPLYAAADLFILPTLYDPFSNACLEALAAGLPVLTTNANGFAEIMTDGGHGSIFPAGNAAEACRAIRHWLDAGRRRDARPALLALAAQYDIARNVERTLEILLQEAARAESTSGKIRKT